MTLYEKLNKIQIELKVPKSQRNTFGNYDYRSCEDILEALKKPLEEQKMTLIINDEIELVGDRYYVKAIATLVNCEDGGSITVTARAREAQDKKGMDDSQITGAASSYARKYALNGLFLIDDTRDADGQDNTKQDKKPATPPAKAPEKKATVAMATQQQIVTVKALCIELKKNIPEFEATLKRKIEELTFEQAKEIIEKLKVKQAEKNAPAPEEAK